MTSLAQNRMNLVLALAIPATGALYLTSSGSLTMNPSTVSITLGLGALWLAAVVAVNALQPDRGNRVDRGLRVMHDLNDDRATSRSVTAAYVLDVSRPAEPWRWTSVLLAPVELLGLAWSVPAIILLIVVPIGLALAGAFWLGRLLLDRL